METVIYAMRHGQKHREEDPALTLRGKEQVAEAAKLYLANVGITSICCGNLRRHNESADIAAGILQLPINDIFRTHLLTIEEVPGIEDVDRCVEQALKHPEGLAAGFRIDNWYKLNPAMMQALNNHFRKFLNCIILEGPILAISSSPLIESATLDPEHTWLLNEAGIIKYILDEEHTIVSQEIVFDGFRK
jgi:broad specificity phosphatase PhoE